MDQKLLNKLTKRKEEGTLRSLSHFEGFADFYSNDYFGLSRLETKVTSHAYGSTGSRLISGNSLHATECEDFLAEFFGAEAALVFNSGYDANVGFFSSVLQRGDTVFYDESIHASVRDGIRLSNAHSYSFHHNDLTDLEVKLKKTKGTVYVAVEGLYSMDGDIAPLSEMADLASLYGAYLVVDEAHSAGVFGNSGKGLTDELGIREKVFARVVTFGKAYGSHGAVILGERSLIDYLINFARSFIYTTALPPTEYERIRKLVGSEEIKVLQVQLQMKIARFVKVLHAFQSLSDHRSPIQMIRIGNIEKTHIAAAVLHDYKLAVKPIFSPTVKVGDEGIRICLHNFNTDTEIDELLHVLNNFQK